MLIGDDVIDAWLREDAPFGDLTSEVLGIGTVAGRIRFAAPRTGVVCCIEEAARLLVRCGAESGDCLRASGDPVTAGTPLLEADGPAAALHLVWRAAGTLIEYASGIATATRRIVEAARAVAPAIAVECTRKSHARRARACRPGGGCRRRQHAPPRPVREHPDLSGALGLRGRHRGTGRRLEALGHAQPGRRIVVEARSLADTLSRWSPPAPR